MIKLLLITGDQTAFSDMTDAFKKYDVQIDIAQTCDFALTMIKDACYDLLIADEHLPDMSAEKCIKKVVIQNPLINCVAVSSLSHKDFHDTYEGMGVLMQFPHKPSFADVQKLMQHLDKIHKWSKKQ